MKKLIVCIGLILSLTLLMGMANATEVSNIETIVVEPTPEPLPTPEPTPTPEITKVSIEFKEGRKSVYTVGETITFISFIEGIALEQLDIQYQWQYKLPNEDTWYDISGANSSEYTFAASMEDLNKSYRLMITARIIE